MCSAVCCAVCCMKVLAVCSHLPRSRHGKMIIDEFLRLPILSEEAFLAMDRNNDGFLTRGEIKLVNKEATMEEVKKVITEYDFDKDGRLNLAEYKQYLTDQEEDAHKVDTDTEDNDDVIFIENKE